MPNLPEVASAEKDTNAAQAAQMAKMGRQAGAAQALVDSKVGAEADEIGRLEGTYKSINIRSHPPSAPPIENDRKNHSVCYMFA